MTRRAGTVCSDGYGRTYRGLDEAEQIVAAVRAHQREVWYMLAPTEGHSFRKAMNRDTFYGLMATFFGRYLVQARAQPDTEE